MSMASPLSHSSQTSCTRPQLHMIHCSAVYDSRLVREERLADSASHAHSSRLITLTTITLGRALRRALPGPSHLVHQKVADDEHVQVGRLQAAGQAVVQRLWAHAAQVQAPEGGEGSGQVAGADALQAQALSSWENRWQRERV